MTQFRVRVEVQEVGIPDPEKPWNENHRTIGEVAIICSDVGRARKVFDAALEAYLALEVQP